MGLQLRLFILQASCIASALGTSHATYDFPFVTNLSEFDTSGKYKYVGCFDPGARLTDLPHIVFRDAMSSARCYMYCTNRGNVFFGLRPGSCHCGNTYGTVGPRPESACNSSCELQPQEKCGGKRAMSVYTIIERFTYIGCFNESYSGPSGHKSMGSNFTKLACALTCKRDARSPFFGLRNHHECECIFDMREFSQRPSDDCTSTCLETGIISCGQNDLTSVYNMEHAQSKAKVLDSVILFKNQDRQILLEVKHLTMLGVFIQPNARLLLKLHSESARDSGNFSELIGATPEVDATPCPEGWIGHSLTSSAMGSDGRSRTIKAGIRCYRAVRSPALNWTEALQRCWRLDSDLYYEEDRSELDFLARSDIGFVPLWIGMHKKAGSGTFDWTEDTTGTHGEVRRQLPRLEGTMACVQLTPSSRAWMTHICNSSLGYICKRSSSVYSSWDYQFPKPVKPHRRVRLALHQSVNGTVDPVPAMLFNLSIAAGTFTAQISAYPGSRLRYDAIERVPMKLCRTAPEGSAATHYECVQPGNARPQMQFNTTTCPNESFVRNGIGSWRLPLTGLQEDVLYYVTEVLVNNPLNLSFKVEPTNGVACSRVGTFDNTWLRFSCNAQMRGLLLSARDAKYPYMHMCDLQVFGKFVSDSTPIHRDNTLFSPSDRIVDLKVQGIFQDGETSERHQPVSDDLYLWIYYDRERLSIMHHRNTDYISIPLKLNQSINKMLMFNTALNHITGEPISTESCSARLQVGSIRCPMINSRYMLASIRERINLHSCSQSSRLSPVDYCENAYNFIHFESDQQGRCAQTLVSERPWWKARVQSTFVFEELVLYSRSGNREWTRNFNVSIERSVCVNAVNGRAFDKKSFECNLAGTEITVTALSDRVSLAICELVAYGRPGGCGEVTYKRAADSCDATIRSHINFGSAPYERGMRCQWVISVSPSHTVLLTFPVFRTASDKDYVAVYEGKGTSGRLIKRFYGNSEHRPKYPWMTAHGLVNYIKGMTPHMTVVFVTDRNPPADVNRNAGTHKGFMANLHLIQLEPPSYLFGTEGIVCSLKRFVAYLESFCQYRKGVHPRVFEGEEIGTRMVQLIEDDLRRRQNRSMDEVDPSPWLQSRESLTNVLRRRKREVSERLLRLHYCTSDEEVTSLAYWRQMCCCRVCNRMFYIQLCLQPYESVPLSACHIGVTREQYRLDQD